MKITEGYMPYLGYKTYYRIAGECSGNKKPLILLHGGPGSTHNYFEVLDRLADEGRAIISYDQLGCGNSYVEGHSELWCPKTWMNELIELRKYLGLNELHLLGRPGAECSQSNTYPITNQKGSNPLFFPAPTHLPNCGPMNNTG